MPMCRVLCPIWPRAANGIALQAKVPEGRGSKVQTERRLLWFFGDYRCSYEYLAITDDLGSAAHIVRLQNV